MTGLSQEQLRQILNYDFASGIFIKFSVKPRTLGWGGCQFEELEEAESAVKKERLKVHGRFTNHGRHVE